VNLVNFAEKPVAALLLTIRCLQTSSKTA